MKYFILLFFLCANFFLGISQTSSKPSSKKAAVKSGKQVKAPESTSSSGNTDIILEENVFDFGNVNEGESVTHRVWLTNTGSKALTISDISAPCITADYSFSPIGPGQKSYIDITFSTEGKVGTQYREVKVRGNIANHGEAVIYVKGVVYPR